MIFQESKTVELKSIVVDDIKKESLHLQIVKVENYMLAFKMM